MKKNILLILIFSLLLSIYVSASEYADVPLSVIMENRYEKFDDQGKMELESTLRALEAKDKEILYLKNQLQNTESSKKTNKKVKKNVAVGEKKKILNKEIKYKDEILLEPYTNIVVKGGLKLPSKVSVQDTKVDTGVKGDIEYIKGDLFLKGLELGGGIGFDFITWINDNTTVDGSIVVGEDVSTTETTFVDYKTSIIMVPLYLTAKYNPNLEIKFLDNTYGFLKLGYNVGIGGDVKVAGSMFYGLGIGKNIGNFGVELEYNAIKFNADYSKNHYENSTLEKKIDISNNRISLNVTYKFSI